MVSKLVPCTADAYLLFHEGLQTFSEMEHNGIRIDVDYLNRTIKEFDSKIATLEDKMRSDPIYQTWRRNQGEKTNLGSRSQLAELVYGELGYTATAYTTGGKTGKGKIRAKAGQEELEKIDEDIVKWFIEAERLKKAQSTYLLGVKYEMVERDGMWFVHPMFHLNITQTYRSGCEKPNFQNIPIRNAEIASLVRPLYIPLDGYQIVETDFSGIEVKVAYCYHKDPQMERYLKDPSTDMHRDMASQIFILPIEYLIEHKDWAKRTVRDSSKNQFVFPQFYGSVYFNCAPAIWERMHRDKFKLPNGKLVSEHLAEHGITELGETDPDLIKRGGLRKGTFVEHLKNIEYDFWNNRFPIFTAWKKRAYETYKRTGYIDLYTGFRCGGYMPKNEVINYFIQGPAFHCLLWAANKINRWLKRYKMKTRLIGQIHDSLIANTHPKERDDYLDYCIKVMTVDLPKQWPWMIAPLEVEAELTPIDKNWHTKQVWVSKDDIWRPKDMEKWEKLGFGDWRMGL